MISDSGFVGNKKRKSERLENFFWVLLKFKLVNFKKIMTMWFFKIYL